MQTISLVRGAVVSGAGALRNETPGVGQEGGGETYEKLLKRTAFTAHVEGDQPSRLAKSSSGNVWVVLRPLDPDSSARLRNVKTGEAIELPFSAEEDIRGIKFFANKAIIVSENPDRALMTVHIVEPGVGGKDVVAQLPALPSSLDLKEVHEANNGRITVGVFSVKGEQNKYVLYDLRKGTPLLPPNSYLASTIAFSTPEGDLLYRVQSNSHGASSFRIFSALQSKLLTFAGSSDATANFTSLPVFDNEGHAFAVLPRRKGQTPSYYDFERNRIATIEGFSAIVAGPTKLDDGTVAVLGRTSDGNFRLFNLSKQVASETVIPKSTFGSNIDRIWLVSNGRVFALRDMQGCPRVVTVDELGRSSDIYRASQPQPNVDISQPENLPGCSVVKFAYEAGSKNPWSLTQVLDEQNGQILYSFTQNSVVHFMHDLGDGRRVIVLRKLVENDFGEKVTGGFDVVELPSKQKLFNGNVIEKSDPFVDIRPPVEAPNGNWYSLAKRESGEYVVLNLSRGSMGAPINLDLTDAKTLRGLTFCNKGEPLVIGENPEGERMLLVLGADCIGTKLGTPYNEGTVSHWMTPLREKAGGIVFLP